MSIEIHLSKLFLTFVLFKSIAASNNIYSIFYKNVSDL